MQKDKILLNQQTSLELLLLHDNRFLGAPDANKIGVPTVAGHPDINRDVSTNSLRLTTQAI
jgi:hypothetical protein